MAGKVTKKEIADAITSYCTKHGAEAAFDEATDSYHLKDSNNPECVFGPGLKCSSESVFSEIKELLVSMRMDAEPTKSPMTEDRHKKQTNTAIAPRKSIVGPLAKPDGLTARDVIDYINPKATEQEAYLFAEFCRRKGADPMTKQVYLAIFEGEKGRTVSFIAGKEYFTEKAETHPQFDGFEAGIIIRPKEGGELVHREGTFYLPSEEMLLGGWASVHRKDRKLPSKSEVVLGEYNTGKNQWAKMPATMIRKVAIVQALREAFPQNLGGMYDKAEIDQAMVDIDPSREVIET